MPVYRVRGYAGEGDHREMFFEAVSEAVAREMATRAGMFAVTSVEAGMVVPEHTPVQVRERRERPEPRNRLAERPVLTIAMGVFGGLFLWSVFVIALGLALGFVGWLGDR